MCKFMQCSVLLRNGDAYVASVYAYDHADMTLFLFGKSYADIYQTA